MSSQTVILKFNDLKCLSSAEIIEAIAPETAVEVTLKSIRDGEICGQDVYKTWATSLFKSYGPDAITDNDLKHLFESFSLAIQDLLKDCGECQNDEQIEKLHEFLNYSLELFNWIQSTAKEFDTNKITSFLCFGLTSLNDYLLVLSKQTSRINVRKLIEKSIAIHTVILDILTEHPKSFCFDSNESMLNSLMSGLCAVGEVTPKLDIRTAIETWKCITRLASQNVIHAQSENICGEDVIWLLKPMSFLIKEIGRNVQTVYTQNSLTEPIQQIQKFLKVTNFYLRLLCKLCDDFSHVPFLICEDFIGTLSVVFNPPVYIANSPVYKVILEYIGHDLKDMISLAYKNDVFFEQLLSEHSGNVYTKEAVHQIILEVIEVIIRKNEPKYINKQLLDTSLKIASECYINGSTTKYNSFVEHLSSLPIRFTETHFEKKLCLNILQDDTIQALTAIDIFCSTFCLTDSSTRVSYLTFWTNINEKFAMFSNSLPALHTQLLLTNLYTLLSCEEKVEMWRQSDGCTLRNHRFLLTIGLDAIPNNCPSKRTIVQHFLKELFNLLKKSTNDMTIQDYYLIVKDLKLLKPIDVESDDLIGTLLQYFEKAIQNNQLYLLVEGILDFIAPKTGVIDSDKTHEVVTSIRKNIALFDEYSTKMCFIRFFKDVSKLPRFEQQCKETLKTLNDDEQIKHFKFLEEDITNTQGNVEKLDDLWKKIIQNRTTSSTQRPHVCNTKDTHVLSTNSEQKGFEVLLKSLENDANKLHTKSQCRELSISNLETLKRIVLKLQDVGKINF